MRTKYVKEVEEEISAAVNVCDMSDEEEGGSNFATNCNVGPAHC